MPQPATIPLIVLIILNDVFIVNTYNIYYPSLIHNEYNCNSAADGLITSNDHCIISCNDLNLNKETYTVKCGQSAQCTFTCDVDKCFDSGLLFASNSTSLTVTANAMECMRRAIVYTPNIGDATLSIGSNINAIEGAFKEMTINGGTNTNSITINCSGNGSTKECRYLTVNAEDTEYLEINADDNASIDYSTINCPENSNYNGPESAACIIDATGSNILATNMHINTLNGSPQDIIFLGSTTGDFTDSVLNCNAGISQINGNSFVDQGNCWITSMPTIYPTIIPTKTPTISPNTDNPTSIPTISPSISPTYFPSIPPTTTALPTTSKPTTASPTMNKPITEIPITSLPTTTTSTSRLSSTAYVETSDIPLTSTLDTELIMTSDLMESSLINNDLNTSNNIDITIVTDLEEDTSTTITPSSFHSTINKAISSITKRNRLDIILYIAIFIGLAILAICIVRCIFILNKEEKKKNKDKRGEPEIHSVDSQEIAISNDSICNDDKYSEEKEIELAIINSMIMETNINTHIIQTSSSLSSLQQILREGNVSQIIFTPQIPEMKEEITEEELMEIKRRYNKKKSTLSGDVGNDDNINRRDNIFDDHGINEIEREDSEELYVDNNDISELKRYDTPTFGVMEQQQSGHKSTDSTNTSTPLSDNPAKLKKFSNYLLGPAKTAPQWM